MRATLLRDDVDAIRNFHHRLFSSFNILQCASTLKRPYLKFNKLLMFKCFSEQLSNHDKKIKGDFFVSSKSLTWSAKLLKPSVLHLIRTNVHPSARCYKGKCWKNYFFFKCVILDLSYSGRGKLEWKHTLCGPLFKVTNILPSKVHRNVQSHYVYEKYWALLNVLFLKADLWRVLLYH